MRTYASFLFYLGIIDTVAGQLALKLPIII